LKTGGPGAKAGSEVERGEDLVGPGACVPAADVEEAADRLEVLAALAP
jgi:hypothetical protein